MTAVRDGASPFVELRDLVNPTPLKVQQSTGEETEIVEVFGPPPTNQVAVKLANTASFLPLVGLMGLLSLATAGCCGVLTARRSSENK
jgi:hypothetical protein